MALQQAAAALPAPGMWGVSLVRRRHSCQLLLLLLMRGVRAHHAAVEAACDVERDSMLLIHDVNAIACN
jgi:hypothetical protein